MTMKVAVAVFQTGCANNILPLAKALLQRGCAVDVFCAGASARTFQSEDVPCQPMAVDASPAAIADTLGRARPDVLVTGSNAVNRFEFEFRLAAAAAGIPCATLIDFWNKIEERFHDASRDDYALPDAFFVIDETARAEVLRSGYGHKPVFVTGSPYYEYLAAQSARLPARKKTRRKVLFVSQPLAALYGSTPEQETFLGFDEYGIFESVRRSLGDRSDACLYLKTHPREDAAAWRGRLGPVRSGAVLLTQSVMSYKLLHYADAVVGIYSNMLIEAAVLGKPTLSVQCGSTGRMRFFGSVSGIVPTVYAEADLGPALSGLLSRRPGGGVEVGYLYENAIENCLAHIYRLGGRSE